MIDKSNYDKIKCEIIDKGIKSALYCGNFTKKLHNNPKFGNYYKTLQERSFAKQENKLEKLEQTNNSMNQID